jgi:hypothetical protein
MAAPVSTVALPEIDDWEVPIECHRCRGAYSVVFRHFRSGVVFRCPYCDGSYVVQSTMHNHVARELSKFHAIWSKEFDAFQARRQQARRPKSASAPSSEFNMDCGRTGVKPRRATSARGSLEPARRVIRV